MKKRIAVISFLISMVIVISHDIIPHNHVDPDETEMVSNQLNENHGQRNSKNNLNHKNHFPYHQHVISDGDFISGRNTISISKVLNDSHQDFGTLSILVNNLNDNNYFTGFVRVIKKPLSSFPFIITLNSIRGSPFLS